YPWGGVGPFGRSQAQQAGYRLAVTVRPGLARANSDPLLLPRIALSEAQLGGNGFSPVRTGSAWRPAALQIHLARARASAPVTEDRLSAEGRLRLGFLVDNPQAWAANPDSHRGGSELQLRRILEALDPRYFEIELYFLRHPPQGLPEPLAWPRFAAAPHTAGRLAVVLGMRRLLRQRRPALVQAMFQDSLFLGIPGAWLAGVPARLCARRNAGHWKRWHHRWALRAVNRMTTAWQTNSASIAAMLVREEGVPAAAIEILPNWIDLERFHPANDARRQAARAHLGLPMDAWVAVAVANYTPVKNHATLVQAAAQVCAELPSARFVFVGEGPEEPRLKAAIAGLGLESNVWLTGAVDEVEAYLAAADVGVLSSTSEGCSNAVMEYMAAGLPTVVSDIPANRALTDDGLAPALDPAAWAAALLALAADPSRRQQLGKANRRRMESYGSATFAERVQAHYVRAAGGL
ncbi:MAG: glycosyltransferase, partial [Terriglobales bacterium]